MLGLSHGHWFVGLFRKYTCSKPVKEPTAKKRNKINAPSSNVILHTHRYACRLFPAYAKIFYIVNCLLVILWGLIQSKQDRNRNRSKSLERFQSRQWRGADWETALWRFRLWNLLQAVVESLSSLASFIQLDGRKVFLKNIEDIPFLSLEAFFKILLYLSSLMAVLKNDWPVILGSF